MAACTRTLDDRAPRCRSHPQKSGKKSVFGCRDQKLAPRDGPPAVSRPGDATRAPSLRAGKALVIQRLGLHQVDELLLAMDAELGVDVPHVGAGGALGDVELA